MSRLLESIQHDIRVARDPGALAIARTREAIYLSRKGDFEAARRAISEIRALAVESLQMECIARANLAEGVLLFHVGSIDDARDKLLRGLALARAGQLNAVVSWCAAWVGQIEMNCGRPDGLRANALQVREFVDPADHASLSRIGIAIADGLHFAGRYDLARPWYEFARNHAVEEGDDAAIDAIMHNVAALRINNLRLAEIDGTVDSKELHRAKMDLVSCQGYNRGIASKTFRWMLPMLQAQVDLLGQEYQSSAVSFDRLEKSDFDGVPGRTKSVALADLSYCLLMVGKVDEAQLREQAAQQSSLDDLALDEQALLCSRFASIATMRKDAKRASVMNASAQNALRMHREIQAHYVRELSPLGISEKLIAGPPTHQ